MKLATPLMGLTAAAMLASCAGIPKDMSVAEYCADDRKAFENVCRLKVEIDGNSTALAETNMSLRDARSIADRALSAAGLAQASADRANLLASQAMSRAESALAKEENLTCETRTIQKTKIGSCQPGYTLMSCTQSRYTTRSGGPSILREIDDKQCRYHDRVLEIKARCCMTTPSMTSTPVPVTLRRY